MPGKKNITILKTETAKKILAKKDAGRTSGGGRSGARATVKNPPPVYGRPQLIKIVAEANEKGGYYKVKPVVRDVSSGTSNQEETKENKWFDPDLTNEMYGLEIAGTSGLKEDEKKAYMAMPIVDSSGRLLWAFSVGGSSKPYLEVLTVETGVGTCKAWNSYSSYIQGEDPAEESALFIIPDATSKAVQENSRVFAADKYTDGQGQTVYIVEAYLLS